MISVNHDYYIIELNNVKVPTEVFEWLKDNFGDGRDGRWFLKYPKLYFKNKHDHLMFTLWWS